MSYLENIQSPKDFRKFDIKTLNKLAKEVRERIISVVSETGGHLAPSLGSIELTIALHYVYNTPNDKLIWDVGHQAYAHKILTGRNNKFDTIRQYNGLSGFPRTSESEYDVFGVGHASTSISAALGFAKARDLKKEKNNIIAVIGDGSMTGGLSFEGLNNAGALKSNMTVVLNDNKMSISPNVGALSTYLSQTLSDSRYNKLKKDVWDLTGKMMGFGNSIRGIAHRVDESLKNILMPGKFFEDLGFRYFGPVDGHDLTKLIPFLKNIKNNVTGPVLVHLITKKGKGYSFAEKNAPKFHGVGSFKKETGATSKKTGPPTYSDIFGKTLARLAEENEKIIGITAAMPIGTGMNIFAEKYPHRCFDVGIAEGHAVTFAGGLASEGFKPVVAIYSTFLQRSYDQIIHDIALQNLNVVFCLDRGGLTPDDGPTHHGSFDMSFLRCVPNATIMAPKDENEMQNMMYSAFKIKGPVFIRYPRGKAEGVGLDKKFTEIKKKSIEVVNKGEDILIIAVGEMVNHALRIFPLLKKREINPTIVNARFIKPLSEKELKPLIESHDKLMTLEAGTVLGGFGSSIAEFISKEGINDKKFAIEGFPDEFIAHGNKDRLYKDIGLSKEDLVKKISEL